MLRLFKLRDRLCGLCGLCGLCLSILLSGCGGGGGGSIDVGAPVLPGTGSGSGAGSTSSASVTLAVSSPTLTVASPVTVTLTVRDAKGSPMAGAVIDLSTERGTLASLNVVSVATDAKGNATALLSAPSGGLSGADQVIGVAKLGTTTVQGSVSFTVASSQPTIGLTISASTLRGSTGAETLRALVKDAAGSPATNTLVSFTSVGGRVVLGAPSAKTDGLGVATVTAAVGDSTLTAADTLTVSATVGTVAVTSALVVQLLADLPSLSVTASNSNVTAAAPATLSILVKSSTGLAVGAGTLVKVSSLFGLSAFDAVTLATNSIGMAQLTVTPRAANSNGADQIDLTSTVGGVTITVPYVVQVSSSNLNAPPVLQT